MKNPIDEILLVKNSKLFVFSGRERETHSIKLLEDIYQQWKKVWVDVFQNEMQLDHRFYSDDFTRQDKIIALYFKDMFVGTAFIREVNQLSTPIMEDSCFRYWPKAILESIKESSIKMSIASHFTIHHDFRGRDQIINWKDLFLSLYLESFKSSDSEILVTAARKKKSNENLCYKFGAKPFSKGLPYLIDGKNQAGDEEVDLLFWSKEILELEDRKLRNVKNIIWKSRFESSEINYLNKEVLHVS
ncbi:MAG: hypothetical protein K2P81_13140 [Bacteriovoracaceae bacterium]|nr:hypothetical protein [Bacteriovoracaceae bacterium]